MRLCVCGLGKVGKPILDMWRAAGLEAVGYDINPKLSEVDIPTAVENSDAAIFIVQTPSLPNGSFDNQYLFDALNKFSMAARRARRSDYLYIVASTTTPGSCDKFRNIVGDRLCYKPEFIRLEYVREDLVRPAYHLIGSNSTVAAADCTWLYRRIARVPVYSMTLLEAELAKITLNCALTMKISLANQLHLVATKLGARSDVIMESVGADPRIGYAYMVPGTPYGGPCLPRDNRMFRYVAEQVGVDAALSLAADTINRYVTEAMLSEETAVQKSE